MIFVVFFFIFQPGHFYNTLMSEVWFYFISGVCFCCSMMKLCHFIVFPTWRGFLLLLFEKWWLIFEVSYTHFGVAKIYIYFWEIPNRIEMVISFVWIFIAVIYFLVKNMDFKVIVRLLWPKELYSPKSHRLYHEHSVNIIILTMKLDGSSEIQDVKLYFECKLY